MFNMYRKCCYRCCCNNCCYNKGKCCKRIKYCEYCNRGMEKYEVTMDKMLQMQTNGAVVCDIRSPQEYNEGHLPGAILLPEYDIFRNALKIFPNKQQEIILYCGTGSRSYSALRKLQRLGYTNVYNLYKGTENY